MMKKIFVLLRSQTGHDFSLYKPTTIHRRIERRMAVHQIENYNEYFKYLQRTPVEIEALFRDLLIGVTNFFRDPEAFKALEEEIIPKLFASKPAGGVIRVWSTGCSTGEEAYSIAILLQEQLEALKRGYKVQVFATDIDSQAIATARAGLYPASCLSDISPERQARFFVPEPDGSAYRIHKGIRDLLVFSEQNVIKDPPFSKLDLISCRNLLIYMNGVLQKKIIPLFHYALNPGGFLMLGTSETVGDNNNLFTPIDRKSKLYQRKEFIFSEKSLIRVTHFLPLLPEPTVRPAQVVGKRSDVGKLSLREITERALLAQLVPMAALINGQGDILYLHGRSGFFLEQAMGEPGVCNIFKMAREGLGPVLTRVLHKVVKTKQIERCTGFKVKTNGDFTLVNLTISPLPADPAASVDTPLFLVTLEQAVTPEPAVVVIEGRMEETFPASHVDTDANIAALQQELAAKEDYLQSAIEELETSNEELKSSNEEMQSVNEELQSTNEELETSKEELQSVNEELATVNAELQTKMIDLSRTNNDMNNLLAGTGIGTIFVDHQMRILRFTPSATKIINLILADIGRPVNHILSNLMNYNKLAADIQDVLNNLIPREIEVQIEEGGAWYAMRILPYRTLENVIEGAVITFVEITERIKAKQKLRETQIILQAALDQTQAGVIVAEAPSGLLRYVNNAGLFIRKGDRQGILRGVAINEYVARWHLITLDGSPMKSDDMPLNRAIQLGETCRKEFSIRTDNGEYHRVLATAAPIKDDSGKIIEAIMVFMDITDSRRSEQTLKELEQKLERESESRFRLFAELLPQLAWSCQPDGSSNYLSPQWIAFTGVTEAQQLGFGWIEQIHPEDQCALKSALAMGEPFRAEFRIHHHSGAYHSFDMRAGALRNAAGQIIQWSGLAIAIDEHHTQEQQEQGPSVISPQKDEGRHE